MNSIVLSGRLAKDPELRATESDKRVSTFTIAVSRYASEECDFIDCVCFGKTAENLCKYQKKGSMIELHGHLENNKYTDKEGKNHYRTIVYTETINYISQPQTAAREAKNEQKDAYADMGKKVESDYELPF